MTRSRRAALGGAVLALAPIPAAATTDVPSKVELQVAMQRYIEARSHDGWFVATDTRRGENLRLSVVKPHPMIFTEGADYVLCYDFADADGETVNVDFVLRRAGGRYVVTQLYVSDHQEGTAPRVEERRWNPFR